MNFLDKIYQRRLLKKIKIYIDTHDGHWDFKDKSETVYCYTVYWLDPFSAFDKVKKKVVATKQSALELAFSKITDGYPLPFILRSIVKRSYFREDIEVEHVFKTNEVTK